jgi:hypothetical protein
MAKLIGALKIRTYLGCSESTFMQRVINEGLPAKKVSGEYVTTTEKIDKWLGVKEKVAAETDAKADIKTDTKTKTGKKAKE